MQDHILDLFLTWLSTPCQLITLCAEPLLSCFRLLASVLVPLYIVEYSMFSINRSEHRRSAIVRRIPCVATDNRHFFTFVFSK